MIKIPEFHIYTYVEKSNNDINTQLNTLKEQCAKLITTIEDYNLANDDSKKLIKNFMTEDMVSVVLSSEICAKMLKIEQDDIDFEIARKYNQQFLNVDDTVYFLYNGEIVPFYVLERDELGVATRVLGCNLDSKNYEEMDNVNYDIYLADSGDVYLINIENGEKYLVEAF